MSLMTLSTCYKNVNSISENNKRPFCITKICGNEFHSLVDTGSSITAMNTKTFKELMGEFRFTKITNDMESSKGFRSANGRHINVFGKYVIPFVIGEKLIILRHISLIILLVPLYSCLLYTSPSPRDS